MGLKCQSTALAGHSSPLARVKMAAAAAEDEELPVCRICLSASDDPEDGGGLVSPCKCEGSQKFVHLACLRRWQRSVQLGGSNHPEDTEREERHRVCNVCKGTFNLLPQDRAAMMSDLAAVRPEDVSPGVLLVTKAATETIAAGSQINIALRTFIEAKAAHFRRAVYVLTEIRPAEDTRDSGRADGRNDGSDVVIGVNLSRTLDLPDVSKLDGACSEGEITNYAERGVRVLWMNGGPVKPRTVWSIMCASHVLRQQPESFLERHGVRELIAPDRGSTAVLHGPMPGCLAVAEAEVELRTAAGEPQEVTVLSWAGFAQWSRTQLLGELARGSWGWCRGAPEDVMHTVVALNADAEEGPEYVSLWDRLRHCDRLAWAPDNEFARDFQSRFDSVRGGNSEPADPNAETVNALVRQFESIRRGGPASSS